MKKSMLVAVLFVLMINVSGQNPCLVFTFTAADNAEYVQLDSIRVMNRTQDCDTVLYWPDTVLSLSIAGIDEPQCNERLFQVFQNYPNPVTDYTTVSLFVPKKDQVGLMVTDMLGRVILKYVRMLDKGTHSFRFVPDEGNLYFFTAHWRGNSSTIKILQNISHSGGRASLEYMGSDAITIQQKASENIQSFNFSIGDELLYIGYANTLESGILDIPEESQTYTFQFATNIPCPGTPTVIYEGQVYNTIQIFSQCWLKENLNVGTMIPGVDEPEDNGIIEKYCYDNESNNCNEYGGLYLWNEMMQYTTIQGVQGICPPGWHLPTDEEWKVLEGAVDSQYGIGDTIWNQGYEFHGFDVGTNLKTTSGWSAGGNGTDMFDFSGLPGGQRDNNGYFCSIGCVSNWWTSSETGTSGALNRYLSCTNPGVRRINYYKEIGFSVRCLRDY